MFIYVSRVERTIMPALSLQSLWCESWV